MTAINREEWLQLRNTGLGGSDAGTVLGVNPYKTPLQLYLEKRGELEAEVGRNHPVFCGWALAQVDQRVACITKLAA